MILVCSSWPLGWSSILWTLVSWSLLCLHHPRCSQGSHSDHHLPTDIEPQLQSSQRHLHLSKILSDWVRPLRQVAQVPDGYWINACDDPCLPILDLALQHRHFSPEGPPHDCLKLIQWIQNYSGCSEAGSTPLAMHRSCLGLSVHHLVLILDRWLLTHLDHHHQRLRMKVHFIKVSNPTTLSKQPYIMPYQQNMKSIE